jgi:hypothetical protein
MAASNRVHYYHADACAFGGFFETPIEHNIAPQAPMSLSPAGGYGSARAENFRLEGLMSYKSASTQVSGHLSRKDGHGWVTLVTASVEGLNVMDIVTADRLTAQIATEHPLEGDYPKVNFLGTSFEGLKISGCPITVTPDFDICDQGNGSDYPEGPCVDSDEFLRKVKGQYQQMGNAKNIPDWARSRAIPDWLKARYSWSDEGSDNGSVLGSIVKTASGEFPGTPYGNVFEVPEFGRIFLGELLVDCNTFRLTMLRLEMGCGGKASLAGPICLANGHTIPPG